jgi:hypothetical protein
MIFPYISASAVMCTDNKFLSAVAAFPVQVTTKEPFFASVIAVAVQAPAVLS